LIVATYDQGVRDELWKEQEELGRNFKVVTKEQVKFVDAPLVLAATSNIPYLSEGASWVATKDGGFAKLASELFGLGYLLDSNDYKLIAVKESDSAKITAALKEESENNGTNAFKLGQSLDLDEGYLIVKNKQTGDEKFRVNFVLDSLDLEDFDLIDYLTTADNGNHGVNNTSAEAYRNGRMQLGNLQNINPATGEGMFVIGSAPSHGPIPDAIENFYNTIVGWLPFGSYLKSGNVIAGNEFRATQSAIKSVPQITIDQDQLSYLQSHNVNPQIISKDSNNFYTIQNPLELLRFADHSNGVDRDYYAFQALYQPNTTLGQVVKVVSPPAITASLLSLIEGEPSNKPFGAGQYQDPVSGKVTTIPGAFFQAYGGATRTEKLGEAASNVGVWMDHKGSKATGDLNYSNGQIINQYDPIPNLMGLNFQNLDDITSSVKNVPNLANSDKSPHGTYICTGRICAYDGFDELKKLQQQLIQQ
jgi:hypothetical protein